MNPIDLKRAEALSGARMLPGSFEKRFIREILARHAVDPTAPLSERQAHCLERAAWKFRRQLSPGIAPRQDPGKVAPCDRVKTTVRQDIEAEIARREARQAALKREGDRRIARFDPRPR
jgi:hypothetical protein